MKTLYLDCGMGAAGDMLSAALLELIPDKEAFIKELNALGLPGISFTAESSVKCGITGTHMRVTVNGEDEEVQELHEHMHAHVHGSEKHEHTHEHVHDHEHEHEHDHEHSHDHDHDHEHSHEHDHEHEHSHHHSHSGLHDIEHIVRGHLDNPEKVKDDIMAVYGLIAEAESAAHGVPVTEIHFHEVGSLDAIADVTAVCLLMNMIAPDRVVVSPVHVGFGKVRCAHGILPVPAPATAYILKDVPIYGGRIEGELCTPTGAALLKHFADSFGDMPVMSVSSIGYGMGSKDFPAANCVRALLGTEGSEKDSVIELSCNVDDMTAEQIGFALESFLSAGALDAYTLSIGMKKSRPGTMIRLMCREDQRDAFVSMMFRLTDTIGIRESSYRRYVLDRSISEEETSFGPVRIKRSFGYGVEKLKAEYDDVAQIARREGLSPAFVASKIEKELIKG
ncbi:MAG: nickel pincer cofactor biosynthesis protein LarC [Firmicutes bacterium]|nr:nickel pincer cofactor biosynthesis protein LarC [Bacillota bacterium]